MFLFGLIACFSFLEVGLGGSFSLCSPCQHIGVNRVYFSDTLSLLSFAFAQFALNVVFEALFVAIADLSSCLVGKQILTTLIFKADIFDIDAILDASFADLSDVAIRI